MKTIEEMLRNLGRPEVLEFGLVSNRLPSVNVGGKFEPVDNKAPTTDMVLQMLVQMGGSRYVESLSAKPTQWTTRLDGVGVIAIAAIMRDGERHDGTSTPGLARQKRMGPVLIAHKDAVIEPEDHVLVFCVDKKVVKEVEKLFSFGFHFV